MKSINAELLARLPPAAKELEEIVLGAVMMEGTPLLEQVMSILRPECFYLEDHQRIFRVMVQLSEKCQQPEFAAVMRALADRGELEIIGGAYRLSRLTDLVNSTANLENYCRNILEKYMARELIRICGNGVVAAYDSSRDVFDLLDKVERDVLGISEHIHQPQVTMDMVLADTMREIEAHRGLQRSITGVPTGFAPLDKATRGWQPGDLIILAARPSIGKTAFALKLAREAATHGPVSFHSLEMKARKLLKRMLASESQTSLHSLQVGDLDDQQLKKLYEIGVDPLARLPIHWDDLYGLNIRELRAGARRLKRKGGLSLIVIDYLQLMEGVGHSREQEISSISRGLKQIAGELDVPIIALSQLSRAMEQRGAGRREPVLSDLRESGAIEQDADMVLFLWDHTQEEIEEDGSKANRRLLKIAKARDGILARMEFDFDGSTQTFREHIEQGVANLPPSGFKPVVTELPF